MVELDELELVVELVELDELDELLVELVELDELDELVVDVVEEVVVVVGSPKVVTACFLQ